MAGDRPPPPWASWSREQWQAYRDQQAASCERPGWEGWAEQTGRQLVRMADFYLARLDAEVPA
jgi:hypothetical protein